MYDYDDYDSDSTFGTDTDDIDIPAPKATAPRGWSNRSRGFSHYRPQHVSDDYACAEDTLADQY